ncbi:hypothetical protein Tco_0820719 [Tanacetum coccineum]|uniref:Uncharacterized protein n=1 Tax=Tanacetum coccineum TaxID=301880 RepID=A0ABQ5AA77_9ASTR
MTSQRPPTHRTSYSGLGPVWGCDRLLNRAKVIRNQLSFISSDSSNEKCDHTALIPGFILFGDNTYCYSSTISDCSKTSTICLQLFLLPLLTCWSRHLSLQPTGLCVAWFPYTGFRFYTHLMSVFHQSTFPANQLLQPSYVPILLRLPGSSDDHLSQDTIDVAI